MQEPSAWLCCVCWFYTVDIEQPLVLLSLTTQLFLLPVVQRVITWFSCSYHPKPAMLAVSFYKAQIHIIAVLGNLISPDYVSDWHFYSKQIQFGSLVWLRDWVDYVVFTSFSSLYIVHNHCTRLFPASSQCDLMDNSQINTMHFQCLAEIIMWLYISL